MRLSSCLLARHGSSFGSIRLGLAGYGVMISPHGLLDLLEVGAILVAGKRERERRECERSWFSMLKVINETLVIIKLIIQGSYSSIYVNSDYDLLHV